MEEGNRSYSTEAETNRNNSSGVFSPCYKNFFFKPLLLRTPSSSVLTKSVLSDYVNHLITQSRWNGTSQESDEDPHLLTNPSHINWIWGMARWKVETALKALSKIWIEPFSNCNKFTERINNMLAKGIRQPIGLEEATWSSLNHLILNWLFLLAWYLRCQSFLESTCKVHRALADMHNTNLLILGRTPPLSGALILGSFQRWLWSSLWRYRRNPLFSFPCALLQLPFRQAGFAFLFTSRLLASLFTGITSILLFTGVMGRCLRDYRIEDGKERREELEWLLCKTKDAKNPVVIIIRQTNSTVTWKLGIC